MLYDIFTCDTTCFLYNINISSYVKLTSFFWQCVEEECSKPGETTSFVADEAFGEISSPYFMLSHEIENVFTIRHYIGEVCFYHWYLSSSYFMLFHEIENVFTIRHFIEEVCFYHWYLSSSYFMLSTLAKIGKN